MFGAVSAGAAETKPYPLSTCIVTDNKLGSMGTPVTLVYEGQEVKFCCKPCVKKFRKDPAKYLAKIQKKKSR
jgi:YHS domain-containing protein